MPASIGVNLRVTGHCRQGGRKYMEDFFSVAYQQTEDEKDLEYAFFGIYDGHGGAEAAAFAKEHLMETIIKHKNFWSDYDEDVLRAIKDGYIATHYAMWKEQGKWPKTASGLPSTAGTTASIAFIRRGKIYIGHVGDSGIILGYQEPGSSEWKAKPLTRDHKPENADEMSRIKRCGGKVVSKSGVPRVVWNRPKIGHQGPVRRSTPIDEIPFLAVARSLGDLWSYNSQINQFIVSPDPDCSVIKIDTNMHRCLIFGTDGLYNMLSPSMAVHIVQQAERHNEHAALSDSTYKTWMNPSKLLVEKALERWHATKMRADNTSVVTLMLDPPGPPRVQVLKDRKKNLPERGLKILTRFEDNSSQETNSGNCSKPSAVEPSESSSRPFLETVPEPIPAPTKVLAAPPPCTSDASVQEEEGQKSNSNNPSETVSVSSSDLTINYPLKERNFVPKLRESTSFDPREPMPRNVIADNGKENQESSQNTEEDNTIQCNEVSSSNIELDSSCTEEEETENNGKIEKHNLRSTKKGNCDKDCYEDDKIRHSKRKRETEDSPQLRKSMRIDQNQKKANETVDKNRKASEAEEKLKKLAEKADQVKKSTVNFPLKLNIIKKSQDSETQKTNVNKEKRTNKKLQLVLEKVKNVKKSALLKSQNQKLDKGPKVLATKIQRHTKQNVSQSRHNFKEKTKRLKSGTKQKSTKNITKDRSCISKRKSIATQTLMEQLNVQESESEQGNSKRSLRSSLLQLDLAPSTSSLPQKDFLNKSVIKRDAMKMKKIGKTLQQKSKILRKTMLRKK